MRRNRPHHGALEVCIAVGPHHEKIEVFIFDVIRNFVPRVTRQHHLFYFQAILLEDRSYLVHRGFKVVLFKPLEVIV